MSNRIRRTPRRESENPLACRAMEAFKIIEALPDHERPMLPKSKWPEFLREHGSDEAYLYRHPAYFEEGETAPPRPSPEQIDAALKEFLWLKWMWQKWVDKRWWTAFQAYAMGASYAKIGGRYNLGSRQNVGQILDRIFRDTESYAEDCLRREGRNFD